LVGGPIARPRAWGGSTAQRVSVLALRQTLNFLKTEAGGGALLAITAVIGFCLANSPWSHLYQSAINADFTIKLGGFSETLTLQGWVRDGLMAVFFFVVGLEIKQEVLKGELSSPRKLVLPLAAALGGMIAPALVYLIFNLGPGGAPQGWPVPTATDIAFALAALALVGRGLPQSLRIFLLAMAIADDLGAVGLIAILFTHQIHAWPLAGAALTLVGLVALSEWRDAPLLFRLAGYLVLGAFTLKSGVNTSLAGVAGALTVPIGSRRPGQEAILARYLRGLHPYVAYGVLPLFALTSTGISLANLRAGQIFEPAPLGVMVALILGKQLGVIGAVWIAIRSGLARRPTGASWLELYGVSLLCGVGFTLSLFMTGLAFAAGSAGPQSQISLGVMIGSVISAVLGCSVLALAAARRRLLRTEADDEV